MLTHEMVHLTFPSVSEDHHWIEEGIASYVEPFARMQAGNLQATRVWGDMMRDMWQGLPREGDEGLDRTHTWASTYWGGALFCLMADVKIRQQTKNKKGLQDALRGIMNAGGNVAQDWDLRRALQVGDKATGTHVLEELYERMRDKPLPVDLDSLWKQLGVERQDGITRFREDAPWAPIRRSINAGKPQP
jgi:predicted metalloprotease with PDZ domain